jgi:hypothetical protein
MNLAITAENSARKSTIPVRLWAVPGASLHENRHATSFSVLTMSGIRVAALWRGWFRL